MENGNGEEILRAEDLWYSYDDNDIYALRGVSLSVKKGRRIALMGENGSGKSTFFLCCNGIYKPGRGTLYFNGKPVDYSKDGLLDLRHKVGIIFQDPDNQLFSASVYQEISFGPMNLGLSEEQVRTEVEEIIRQLEIAPFSDKPTHALSGGQKKQVSIADILVMHPEIIILDEPAAALDPKHTAIVNGIVEKMTDEGITVMMATHNVDFAMEWADEIILFHEGRVLIQASPQEVFANRSVLEKTNLRQPACMQVFDRLCGKGLFSTAMPQPKTMTALVDDIEKIHLSRTTVSEKYAAPADGAPRKKAVLAVSFGTTHDETRRKTIDAIEADLAAAFPDRTVYRAWTSGMIIERLRKRDGISIRNVRQAMEKMHDDGISEILVQPTHILNGVENERMQKDVMAYRDAFAKISFGEPLLTSQEDCDRIIRIMNDAYPEIAADPSHALILMGHGTTHYANFLYAALDYRFKDLGYPNIFVGTVEAWPSMETLLKQVKEYAPSRITLAPFMIVAGEHALKDMAGDDPQSWHSRFRSLGVPTECVLKGLGEYEGVRALIAEHARAAETDIVGNLI